MGIIVVVVAFIVVVVLELLLVLLLLLLLLVEVVVVKSLLNSFGTLWKQKGVPFSLICRQQQPAALHCTPEMPA